MWYTNTFHSSHSLSLSLTLSPFLCARLPLYRNFHSGFVLLSDPNESMTISVRNVINLTTFQHFPHVICRIKSIWNWALAKQVTRTLYSSQPIEYSILLWNTCQNMAHFLKVYWEFHIYICIYVCVHVVFRDFKCLLVRICMYYGVDASKIPLKCVLAASLVDGDR